MIYLDNGATSFHKPAAVRRAVLSALEHCANPGRGGYEAAMAAVIDVIRAIRNRRTEMNVQPSRRAKVILVTKAEGIFAGAEPFLQRLAGASEMQIVPSYEDEGAVSIVTDVATVYIPLADMIDFEAEKKRLNAELQKIEGEIARVEGKLSNESFVAKAPAAVVNAERAKLEKYKATKVGLESELSKL